MKFFIVLLFAFTVNATDVTKVIYCEAGPTCSPLERLYVATVIKNRVHHKGFGSPRSMLAVVRAKNQFSSYGDTKNSNWSESENAWSFSGRRLKAWSQCRLLATGKFSTINKAVYFHDKSISKPRSWDNRYWKTYVITITKHFIFYGVKER